MRESIYRRLVSQSGIASIKKKKKKLLSERLMEDIDNEFGANQSKSLKEFLKRNNL